jgi:hypothetical protein
VRERVLSCLFLVSHPSQQCFVRGLEHVARYMPRAKDARRQVPDPDNEPDFDEITKRFPLPAVTARATIPQDHAATPISGDEAKIRAILQDDAKRHEQEQTKKPKARTFDVMAGGFTNATTSTLDQPPAAKMPALQLSSFAPTATLPPPTATTTMGGLLPGSSSMGAGLPPTNWWALSMRNQQVMEQLQVQQRLQQMLSRMQQGDAAEQLFRSLYNNNR